jgi:hypothetical protein
MHALDIQTDNQIIVDQIRTLCRKNTSLDLVDVREAPAADGRTADSPIGWRGSGRYLLDLSAEEADDLQDALQEEGLTDHVTLEPYTEDAD